MIKEGIFLNERYELLHEIGSGGMANVFKAKDHKLNRYVAVKILKREFREDENFVQKFKVEAQSAAGLMHPNVVNVYDVGQERGLNYMVMELVEGITLKDYIQKKGRLLPNEVISITIQIAAGIEAAHKQQIIHRDIKPQNVIISTEGKVKVTDFGIAKATTSNTISSNAMGSVHYTSPEQARGGFSDEKSDVYSVGITMFEMVTGKVPFDGEATVMIAIKHLQEEIVPPSELVPSIPYSLEQIILKCTQKSADRRYQNMEALMSDLKRSLVEPEGNFVVFSPYVKGTETVMITQDDLDEINRKNVYSSRYDDDYDEDEYDDDEYDDDYDDDHDYDEDEYDREDEGRYKRGDKTPARKKRGDVDPKMKKITKILTILVAVIISLTVLFMVFRAAGIFKSFPTKTVDKSESSLVKVPDIVGLTEAQALDAIEKRGLKSEIVSREESKKYEAGIVSGQKTEADTKVKKGTVVQIVISTGKVAEEVAVPDVAGQTQAGAEAALTKIGLVVETKFEYHAEVADGRVITTIPAAGTALAKGGVLTMVVSQGIPKAVVPELLNMMQTDAEQALAAAGLAVGSVTEENNDAAAGTVINQGVKSGKELAQGTAVNIVVSKGPKEVKVAVPQLSGKTKDDAIQALDAAGLGHTVEEVEDAGVITGYVISSSIAEGTQVAPGTNVIIRVSKGAGAAQVKPEPEPTPDADANTQPGTAAQPGGAN